MAGTGTTFDRQQAVQPMAAALSERYPEARRILLFIAFEEADSDAEPNYQQLIFTPDTAAIFRFDCSRDECFDGGFDLTAVIDGMVAHGETRVHGKLECSGSLGSGGGRCGLKAEYRIVID